MQAEDQAGPGPDRSFASYDLITLIHPTPIPKLVTRRVQILRKSIHGFLFGGHQKTFEQMNG